MTDENEDSKEKQNFNAGVRDAYDLFLSDSPGIEEFIAGGKQLGPDNFSVFGLIDENNNVTEKGLLLSNLVDSGLIDTNFKETDKGVAYRMKPGLDESELFFPRNLKYYNIAKADGLHGLKQEIDFSEIPGQVAETGVKAVKGLINRVGLESVALSDYLTGGLVLDPPERQITKSALDLTKVTAREEFRKTSRGFVAGLNKVRQDWLAGLLADDDATEEEVQRQRDLASQQFDAVTWQNSNYKLGELAEEVGLAVGPQDQPPKEAIAEARKALPKEFFDKLEKEGVAAGQFFGPDNLLTMGLGFVAGKFAGAVTTQVALQAQRRLGQLAALTQQAALKQEQIVQVGAAAGRASRYSEMASGAAKNLRSQFDETGMQQILRRARSADELASSQANMASKYADDLASLNDDLAQINAQAQKMSGFTTNAAKAFDSVSEIGRRVKQAPFQFTGSAMERIGNTITKVDNVLADFAERNGVDSLYKVMSSGVGIAGMVGSSALLGPVPAYVGAAKAFLNSGKLLERFGATTKIIGREAVKARGSIPFWRRVANAPNISSAHRALANGMDHIKIEQMYRGAKTFGAGVAASFPADLAYEYVYSGGDMENALKQAAAESLVIGGPSAVVGGAMVGSKERFARLAAGDEVNFMRDLKDDQKAVFNSAPKGIRQVISTASAVFPNTTFEVVRAGGTGGFHDRGHIRIDLDSRNPLKELIGHEVLHHITHINKMESGVLSLLVGDGEFGGVLRSPDGTLDENFKSFIGEYTDRLNKQYAREGKAPPQLSMEYLANEYFVEMGARSLYEKLETGELSKLSAQTAMDRKIREVFDTAIKKTPFLKNLNLRLGGRFDSNGNPIMGNGLLSEGLRDNPAIRNMITTMVRRSTGFAEGRFDPVGTERGGAGGPSIPIDRADKPMLDVVGPVLFEGSEVNGVWVNQTDKDGDPIPVSKKKDEERSSVGLLVSEAIAETSTDADPNDGRMRMVEGKLTDGWLPDFVTKRLKGSGILNNVQLRIISNINNAIKFFEGNRFTVIYHPALAKTKRGKVRYDSLAATIRDVVPMGMRVTQKGNILVSLMSVNQLNDNIDRLIDSKRGLNLYSRNRNEFMKDIGAVMDLWSKGKASDSHFQEKYGTGWEARKNFVNLAFGLSSRVQTNIDPNTGRVPNPLFLEENMRGRSVFRTYRADRISRATNMSGEKPNMNVVYENVIGNLFPNGLPTLDENGNPVAEKANEGLVDVNGRLVPSSEAMMPEQPQSETQLQIPSVEQFSQNASPKIEEVKSGINDGATFNMDGTNFDQGALIVPGDSINITTDELTPESIVKFMDERKDWVPNDQDVKFGIYRFPNSNKVSIDMNIMVDPKYQDVALEFGKMIGQESLFDTTKLGVEGADPNIKTGADGKNPIKMTPEQFRAAAESLTKGKLPELQFMPETGNPDGAIPKFRNKEIQVTHWSTKSALSRTDPKMHGKGGAGEELKRRKNYGKIYQPRTYFGYGKYKREQQVGNNRYSITANGNDLYDYKKDPLDLYPSTQDVRKAGFAPMDQQAAITLYERNIKNAGYKGYISSDYSAGVLFYPTKLTKVADSDRSLPVEVEQSKRFMPEEDTDVKVVERSDQTTEPGTPAPDSDVQSLPLTGKPIKWNERSSSQLRFMPEYDRDAFPMMDDAILQSIMDETDTVAAIHIDRMGVGRYKGVDLQGGMFYPTILENLQKGIVWAFNSTATARKVLGMAAKNNGYVKLVLMQEGNVVGNKTFANIWFNELNESIQNKKISNAMALTQLNVARRLVYSKIKNKNVNKHPWVLDHSKQWTSIDQAKEALLNMPQQQRAGLYFQKTKTQTKSQGEKISYQGLLAKKMAKMGLPNALEIVNAIEEPAFNGIPTGATVAIIKIDPMAPNEKIMTAEEAGVPEHLSYKYVVKGKPIAKMKYYQIIDEVFPETKGEIITQGLTNFPVEKSIPSAATARGQIEF